MSELAKRLREHDEILRGPDMSLCGGPGTFGHSMDIMDRVRPIIADLVEAAVRFQGSCDKYERTFGRLLIDGRDEMRRALDAVAQAMKEAK